MVSGKSMSAEEYRKIDRLSASDLRTFVTDRKAFYKKNVLKESEDEEYNRSFLIGDLVHLKLLEPENFDSKFYMSICPEPPTGLMLKFSEALFKFTVMFTDEHGNITMDFEDIAKEAYKEAGFKWTFPTVLDKFKGSNAELYYRELREAKSVGKKIVTVEDLNIAEKVITTLKTHDFTREIVNLETNDDFIVLNEVQLAFELEGIEMKAMLDKIVIDLKEKSVSIFDYKIVWDNQKFYREYYTYRRADIQGYVYYQAVQKTLQDILELDIGEFVIKPPVFIVADSTDFYSPVLFMLTDYDLINAQNGWIDENQRYYKGVLEILNELKWHLDNGCWGESEELQKKKGIVGLKHKF